MDDDDSQASAGPAGLVAALSAGDAWGARPGMTLGPRRLHPLQRWWRRHGTRMRAQSWSIVFAAAALVGLLLAFHHVVRGAVTQGEQRRAAVAARELATWRCSTLGGAALRSSCRAALDARPPVALADTSSR